MVDKLPEYNGRLAPAPWGQVRLTGRNKKLLKLGASKGCPTCLGRGWTGGPVAGTPCACLNVRLPAQDRPGYTPNHERRAQGSLFADLGS